MFYYNGEKIFIAIGDRVRFTKNVKHRGQKFLNNELRTLVGIDEGKIIFDKGENLTFSLKFKNNKKSTPQPLHYLIVTKEDAANCSKPAKDIII